LSVILDNGVLFRDLAEIGSSETLSSIYGLEHVQSAVYVDRHAYHYRRNNRDSQTSVRRADLPMQWERLFATWRISLTRLARGRSSARP